MIERVFILKRTEIFREVPDDILASLVVYLEEVHLGPGGTVFKAGDVGKAMYIVVNGQVRLNDGGLSETVLNACDVFGELSVLTSELRAQTATAVEETDLLRLDQDVFYEVMAGNPDVSKRIIKVLVERLN